MKIYTKTGDDGTTGLFGGGRVPKSSRRIDAYGTVDELNAVLGMTVAEVGDADVAKHIRTIQNDLFVLGADLATPLSIQSTHVERISESAVQRLEDIIDELEVRLEPLKNFILPGGSRAAALLHFARNVCRRAERLIVKLSEEEDIGHVVVHYINRLSDLLFVLARYVNKVEGQPETIWRRAK